MGNAPSIVLVVGLLFLVMATMAFIGEKYGAAFTSENAATIINETVTPAELTLHSANKLDGANGCNAEDFAITTVANNSNSYLNSANYTINSVTGVFYNNSGDDVAEAWKVSYTYNVAGVACNVTGDLQTEISNNTSIAGIVLTISLVGIVLSILIGVFLGLRKPRI